MVAEADGAVIDVQPAGSSVYWLELRPKESGRTVIVRRDGAGGVTDVTPPGFDVRTRVHEYGGGAYLVDHEHDRVYFSNFTDQRLYRQDGGGEPEPISAEPPEPSASRYADMRLTPDGRWLVCVRERHGNEEVVNELVLIAADGSDSRLLASGHDFYSSPRFAPDGSRLAWLQWDHPRMPWDGTELRVATVGPGLELGDDELVAGGPEESVLQPEWSPSGALHFISDRTGWWNLYRLGSGAAGEAEPLCETEAEFGVPPWIFGYSRYAFLPDGRIACAFDRDAEPHLGILDPRTGDLRDLELAVFTTSLRSDGRRLVMIGEMPSEFQAVYALDPAVGEPELLHSSRELEIDPAFLAPARRMEFPTEEGRTAHAFFYPPRNPGFEGPAGERPPLIVMSHGGPTSAASGDLELGIQFWTTRGIAVVDVDYGGSTGYGREYRERLRGRWGEVDLQDCINAARTLADRGEVDRARMAITGGSAGGYTTLCALTFSDVFSAGASYYGVGDLEALARDTHKFESRYLEGLVGPYPETKERWRARSPIHSADRLSCPVLLLQGLEDKVVPPQQAEAMVRALDAKGLPYAYLPFEAEQHGFRRAENIVRALEAELFFYARVFGFDLADQVEPVEIANL
jgi:dipeptidyl aminopeptidase/acylaminoacyl peptidase